MNEGACIVKDCDLMLSNNQESITIDSTERHKSISDDDNEDDDGKQQPTLNQFNNSSINQTNDINDDDHDHNHHDGNNIDDADDGNYGDKNIVGDIDRLSTIEDKTSRVSFPPDDQLITGYLEPANPWEEAHNVNLEILLRAYIKSCEKHGSTPIQNVIRQLEKLDLTINDKRHEELSLKNEELGKSNSEPLEEVFRRLQFVKIDLESSGLDDESAETLFDMFEYYESANHVNISHNGNIGARGWQACGSMIKRTLCLEQLEARDIVLTQQHMNILKRPLQYAAHLQILKLENCGLAGRAFVILAAALKVCTGLKELYLADNNLAKYDAIQIGGMLRINHHLQLLDVSNNNLQDGGVKEILKGLMAQAVEENKEAGGLGVLILWNNHFGRDSSDVFSDVLMHSKTLETLNIGQNAMGDEFLEVCKESLRRNQTLLQLGVQSTGLIQKGVLALAEVIEKNETLERIDLRDNNLQLTGLTFLSLALKKNTSITRIDLDDKAISKSPAMADQYIELINEIRGYCERNEELYEQEESTSESTSPEHRSRVSSVSSRKISLTCQTLPARSPPLMGATSEVIVGGSSSSTRTTSSVSSTSASSTMQMAKRTSGGRLRSPAPSPIPSPVASPIPSPSRSRFVVSRVSETSLSSNNSSASSSPVTPPPSFSSPPSISSSSSSSTSTSTSTCFFPSDGSRFRVTVIAPALKINETDFTDSDDSDSVFVNQSSIRPNLTPAATTIRPDFTTDIKKEIQLSTESLDSLELNVIDVRPKADEEMRPNLVEEIRPSLLGTNSVLPTVLESKLPSENSETLMDTSRPNLSTEMIRPNSSSEIPNLSDDNSQNVTSITTIKSSFTTEIRPNFTTDIIRPTFTSEILISNVSSVDDASNLTVADNVTDSTTVEIKPNSSEIRPNVLTESNSTLTDTRPNILIRSMELNSSLIEISPNLSTEQIRPNLSSEERRPNSSELIQVENIKSSQINDSGPDLTAINLRSNSSEIDVRPNLLNEINSSDIKILDISSTSDIRPSLSSNEIRPISPAKILGFTLPLTIKNPSTSSPELNPNLSESDKKSKSSKIEIRPSSSTSDIRPNVASETEKTIIESRSQPLPQSSSSSSTSSLDRLLGLFQNTGSLFTTSPFESSRNYTSPFHRVTSMMALGDKFQKYLREGLIDSDKNSDDHKIKNHHHHNESSEAAEAAFKDSNVPVVSVLVENNDDNHHDNDDYSLPMTSLNVTENCDNTIISINHPNLINNVDNDNDTHLLCNITCDISVNNLLDDLTVDKDHNNDNDDILVNDLLHPEVEIIYEHCESFDDHNNCILIDKSNEQVSLSQNLLIDRSIDRSVAHRNSQDSGIEETNPCCEDNLDGFAGSLDSGIESECSSVCVKADEIVNDDTGGGDDDHGNNDSQDVIVVVNDDDDDNRRLEELKKAFNIPVSNDDKIFSNS